MKHEIRSKTVLAVIKDSKGKLWFAGDRRMSFGDGFYQGAPSPKVNKRDGILMAGSGCGYLDDEIQRLCPFSKYNGIHSPFEHAQLVLLPDILAHLRQRDLAHVSERRLLCKEGDSSESADSPMAILLLGFQSTLFQVVIDTKTIQIDEVSTPFTAGCGSQYAMGSLLTTQNTKMSPSNRLKMAITVAAACTAGCGDGCDIIHED